MAKLFKELPPKELPADYITRRTLAIAEARVLGVYDILKQQAAHIRWIDLSTGKAAKPMFDPPDNLEAIGDLYMEAKSAWRKARVEWYKKLDELKKKPQEEPQ